MCDNIETSVVLNDLPKCKEEGGKKSAVDNESDAQLPTFSSIQDPVFISLGEIKQEYDEEAVGISEGIDNLYEEQTKFVEEIKVEDSIPEITLTELDGNLGYSCPLDENTLLNAYCPHAHCNLVEEDAGFEKTMIGDTPYEKKTADEKTATNMSGNKCKLLQIPEETNSEIGFCSQNMHFNEDSLLKDGFKNDLRSDTLKQPYACEVCKKAFPGISQLRTHFRIHTGAKPFKCEECGVAFDRKSNLNSHMLTHTGIKPYKCDICEKCFTQNQNLIRHRTTHKGVHPYICKICGDEFYKREELKVHKNKHKQNSLTCFDCNKTFSTASALKQHERIHTGDRPHKCQECGKSFLKLSYLTVHAQIHTHTRDRPHKCQQCGKGFYEIRHLTVHAQSHTGERPFKCTECDKSFKDKAYLIHHIRVHQGIRPFKCTHCEKSFTVLRFLHRHMITHSEARPFKCELCGKDFARKTYLRIHHRLHTGERPFECKECGKTFPFIANLNKHRKIHEERRICKQRKKNN